MSGPTAGDADLAVLGGGPAGLACAIAAAGSAAAASGRGVRVLVLERSPRPGRKLLVSGSGRCNVTHGGPIGDFLGRYGRHGRFLKPALFGFDNNDLRAWLAARGLRTEETEDGKVFPAGGDAREVLRILLAECAGLGVELRCGERALEALRMEGGFIVRARGSSWSARALCIATGGRSWPSTGSSGDGYALAASLGHSIAQTAPCLSPVIARGYLLADCAGISLRDCIVEHRRGGRLLGRAEGDLLFTHEGLSGPLVLDLSRDLVPGDALHVRLVPGRGGIEPLLLAELDAHGTRGLLRIAQALGASERLALAAIRAAGLDPGSKASLLDRASRRRLAAALEAMPFTVAALGGWDEAMATRGGVSLAEVDPATMQSRIAPGLFLAGEVLDVDGDTGGYNLQSAFSTGMLAGISAASRIARRRAGESPAAR